MDVLHPPGSGRRGRVSPYRLVEGFVLFFSFNTRTTGAGFNFSEETALEVANFEFETKDTTP